MRYLTEFNWMLPDGRMSGWTTPEAAIAEDLDAVAALIDAHADEDADRIRVTEIGTGLDATAEALNHFGHLILRRTDVWPWWLSDICPEWAKTEEAA